MIYTMAPLPAPGRRARAADAEKEAPAAAVITFSPTGRQPWMYIHYLLAAQAELLTAGPLMPTGVIVGSAVIAKITPPDPSDADGLFRWHLADVQRAKKFRKPRGHPQPVWFEPF
jgi:hypothetical protein